MLFHDATRSFNQWYSCNTCHSDGHTNGLDFDTLNDGRQDLSALHQRSRKKVPTLRRVTLTGPGPGTAGKRASKTRWSSPSPRACRAPGRRPTTSRPWSPSSKLSTTPATPIARPTAASRPAAQRGEAVFRSAKAACNTCHGGPELTDGKIHVTGLEEPDDAYRGYNPPSLRGVYDKDPYLHDGRSKTLEEALSGPHDPDAVTGLGRPSTTPNGRT